jgi:hypothetical protein
MSCERSTDGREMSKPSRSTPVAAKGTGSIGILTWRISREAQAATIAPTEVDQIIADLPGRIQQVPMP